MQLHLRISVITITQKKFNSLSYTVENFIEKHINQKHTKLEIIFAVLITGLAKSIRKYNVLRHISNQNLSLFGTDTNEIIAMFGINVPVNVKQKCM